MKTRLLIVSIAIVLSLTAGACTIDLPLGNVVVGSEDIVSEARDVSGFDRVSVSGGGKMTITQGDEESLVIETDDNIIDLIETYVSGDELVIQKKREYQSTMLRPSRSISYTLVVKDLTALSTSGGMNTDISELETSGLALSTSGGGSITIESFSGTSLEVDSSGGVRVTVDDLSVKRLDVSKSGGGSFTISAGTANDQWIEMSGGGKYRAGDLQSQVVDINSSGGGDFIVWAEDVLDVEMSGGGEVEYYGNPAVNTSLSGGSTLKSLGEH